MFLSCRRPRCDAAGHQDRERPGPESVSPADGPQLQPRLHHTTAWTDGILTLSDARSVDKASYKTAKQTLLHLSPQLGKHSHAFFLMLIDLETIVGEF